MYEPLVIWIVLSSCVHNIAYSVIAPFLPLEFESKGIPPVYSGAVFAIFALAGLLVLPFFARVFERLGHKNLLAVGFGATGIAIVGFGFI